MKQFGRWCFSSFIKPPFFHSLSRKKCYIDLGLLVINRPTQMAWWSVSCLGGPATRIICLYYTKHRLHFSQPWDRLVQRKNQQRKQKGGIRPCMPRRMTYCSPTGYDHKIESQYFWCQSSPQLVKLIIWCYWHTFYLWFSYQLFTTTWMFYDHIFCTLMSITIYLWIEKKMST